jgi:hypothetical protein
MNDSTIMMSQELQGQLLDDEGHLLDEITMRLCIFLEDVERDIFIEGPIRFLHISTDQVEFEICVKISAAFHLIKNRDECSFKEINLLYQNFLEKIPGNFRVVDVHVSDIKEEIQLCTLGLSVKNEKKVI